MSICNLLQEPLLRPGLAACKAWPCKLELNMPRRNSRKNYVEDGHYHIYNRGVEKRTIFIDEQDHKVFLNYLKEYLSPPLKPDEIELKAFSLRGQAFKAVPRQLKNFHKEIELITYCLMPNHFHLLIKQKNKDGINRFIHSLLTRYTRYFNTKYDRVGPLFQGRYKAVLIQKERYLLHLSRYIHLNPQDEYKDLTKAYSSYAEYLGERKTIWVKPDIILSFFKKPDDIDLAKNKDINTYKKFVEGYKKDSGRILGELTLE
jgi:putative transposase